MNFKLQTSTSSDCRLLSIGQCASLACLLEAIAPKPGNVHRGADFEDLTLVDLAAAGVAIGPAMEAARERGVGATVLAAVQAAKTMAGTNANLGIALLLAPLAAVADGAELASGVADVLQSLTPQDAKRTYAAIRLANPGGLGQTAEMDVAGSAPDDLLAAMSAAANRDTIAREYATGFPIVLDMAAPWIAADCRGGRRLTEAIIHTHVRLMAQFPDSLIARKCGVEVARRSAALAQAVLDGGNAGEAVYQQRLADLDFWLRADNHRRNPGTTADLIAAALFVNLRQGALTPPFR